MVSGGCSGAGGGASHVPECINPIWPCALTGAVAFLAGYTGMSVVIHGSSGCYYYPKSLLRTPLYGSFILHDEVVFGTGDRLRSVVADVSKRGGRVAVVNSCVPALMGEDLAPYLEGYSALLVDAPGFLGGVERGYRIAGETLMREAALTGDGVNIGGVCLLDPFWRGNLHEARRMLIRAGILVGTVVAADHIESVSHASPQTVTVNPDYPAIIGEDSGSFLGISKCRDTIIRVAERVPGADPSPLLDECRLAEERVIAACEKYLRRYDPPVAAIAAQEGYATLFDDILRRYLGADPPRVLPRNDSSGMAVTDYAAIADALSSDEYTLILGSSYEHHILPDAAFVGITPPQRGRVILGSPSLAGIEGVLNGVEMILNACMDRKKKSLN